MLRSLLTKHLTLVLATIAFITIVFLLKTSQLNLNLIASPMPSPSVTSSPLATTTPAPSTPASALATPTTSVTGPTITSPSANTPVTSPLTVNGIVPAGWMFEGSFPVKLTDKKGAVIATGTAKEKTPGSWSNGNPVAFTATLTFTTAAKSGFLVIEKDNPSGLPANDESYQIPVKF